MLPVNHLRLTRVVYWTKCSIGRTRQAEDRITQYRCPDNRQSRSWFTEIQSESIMWKMQWKSVWSCTGVLLSLRSLATTVLFSEYRRNLLYWPCQLLLLNRTLCGLRKQMPVRIPVGIRFLEICISGFLCPNTAPITGVAHIQWGQQLRRISRENRSKTSMVQTIWSLEKYV